MHASLQCTCPSMAKYCYASLIVLKKPGSCNVLSYLVPPCRREELITAEECEQAAQSAMALLRHLHAWGAVYEALPEGTSTAERLQMPDPLSTTQAVLQLLSSLTKRHSIALKVKNWTAAHLNVSSHVFHSTSADQRVPLTHCYMLSHWGWSHQP